MKTEEEYKAEVLQLMRDLYPTLKGEEKERAERLFPELKENEDERIRREIIEYLEERDFDIEDTWIPWLRKQGEQKQEWSEDDLISLGYLATFVDENGDSFYGKNKPNVVKLIRSFANLNPTQKQELSEEDIVVLDALIRRLEGEDLYVSTHLVVSIILLVAVAVCLGQL